MAGNQETLVGLTPYGTVYDLTRRSDGMWEGRMHNLCMDDAEPMTFSVNDEIARAWADAYDVDCAADRGDAEPDDEPPFDFADDDTAGDEVRA